MRKHSFTSGSEGVDVENDSISRDFIGVQCPYLYRGTQSKIKLFIPSEMSKRNEGKRFRLLL